MIKSLITASLFVAGLAQAGAPLCSSRHVPAPVPVDKAWARMARFQNRYSDFYYRCGSMIGQLSHAEAQARRFLNSGSLGQAAQVLIDGLVSFAGSLPPASEYESYPLTMESIRQGAEVAKALGVATASDRNVTPRMAAQIKYNVVARIYRAVHKAYEELDTPYYLEVNSACYGGCDDLPEVYDQYYEGVGQLAKDFLNIQTGSAAAQGTDKVELSMTAAAAKAAKKIVLNSVFARDFSCAILELHSIQVEAETFLCEGNPGYNQAAFVEELRERMGSINLTHGCGYRRYHHGGNRGGYGGQIGYSSEVED